MSTEKFQNKYRLKSARAEWHDYEGGAYFITVCTKQREHFFGKINDGQMQLSPIGKYLSENLQDTTQHYPYAEIPLFVVMPNHWHAIIFIDGNKTPEKRNLNCRDVACHVSAEYTHKNRNDGAAMGKDVTRHVSTMKNIRVLKGWLSVAIGGIKSSTTKLILHGKPDFMTVLLEIQRK